MKKTQVGIIGVGFVGGTVRDWFSSKRDADLFLYDKYKNVGSVKEVNKADIVFIAVPTPFHGDGAGYDDSAVREAVSVVEDGKTVVIKSTIVPGTTDSLQKEYPGKTILFNPEFLREATAYEDFIQPHTQLVGYAEKEGSHEMAETVMDLLPQAPFSRVIGAREAEMVKYFRNMFLAARVVFANQIYDLCEKMGVDYDAVKECAAADPRVGGSHFDIWHEGYRGYGGACLVKDVKSLIELSERMGVEVKLLREIDKINNELGGERHTVKKR